MILKRLSLLLALVVVMVGFVLPCFAETVTYEYDDLYRLKKATYSDGTVIEYTYDAAGNRLARTIKPGDSDGDGIPDNLDLCPQENPGGLDMNHDGCTDTQQGLAEEMAAQTTNTFNAAVTQILADPAIPDAAATGIKNALAEVIGNKGGQANNGAADKLRDGNLVACLTKTKEAVQDLKSAAQTGYATSELQAQVTGYARAGVLLAITQAAAGLGQSHPKVVQATQLITQGDTLSSAGDFLGALEKYKKAAQILK